MEKRFFSATLAICYLQQKQPELAIVFFKQSVNVRQTIRQGLQQLPEGQQESYTQSIADTYNTLADLLQAQGRRPEAEQVLALLKVQNVYDLTTGIMITEAEQKMLNQYQNPVNFKPFVDWCLNKTNLTLQTRHTVDVLLKIAGTQNCNQAARGLSNLNKLDLSSNQVTDIKPLSSLTNLTQLDLKNNQVIDIKPLSNLTNLTSLDLSYTQIANIKPLSSLTKLTKLDLENNQMLTNKTCPVKPKSICKF